MTPTPELQKIIDETNDKIRACFADAPKLYASSVPLDEIKRQARREAYEKAAKVAEAIWDNGQEGAHGGEQANRTAAAIRRLAEGE